MQVRARQKKSNQNEWDFDFNIMLRPPLDTLFDPRCRGYKRDGQQVDIFGNLPSIAVAKIELRLRDWSMALIAFGRSFASAIRPWISWSRENIYGSFASRIDKVFMWSGFKHEEEEQVTKVHGTKPRFIVKLKKQKNCIMKEHFTFSFHVAKTTVF